MNNKIIIKKAIARSFIILFDLCVWSPSTIFPHLHLLSPAASHKYLPPHTVPILQSCLSLLIPKSMFKGVSQHTAAERILYFS
jgi:hypothetical protein